MPPVSDTTLPWTYLCMDSHITCDCAVIKLHRRPKMLRMYLRQLFSAFLHVLTNRKAYAAPLPFYPSTGVQTLLLPGVDPKP